MAKSPNVTGTLGLDFPCAGGIFSSLMRVCIWGGAACWGGEAWTYPCMRTHGGRSLTMSSGASPPLFRVREGPQPMLLAPDKYTAWLFHSISSRQPDCSRKWHCVHPVASHSCLRSAMHPNWRGTILVQKTIFSEELSSALDALTCV